MPIGELCSRAVVFVRREDSVREAAQLMRQHHVGNVLVVDEKDAQRVPVGILTDRDIVVEVVAKNVDLDKVSVGDIMSFELASARDTDGVFETIQLMRMKGVRRLPVVNASGGLVGILALDDIIELLAEELSALAKLISREQAQEKKRKV
ncbi:MAG: CBS domain-containing protein [Gammaproteobacteria bacterium]|nr:CBS domain-containing protein [Gammaproteobacteria bacterium]